MSDLQTKRAGRAAKPDRVASAPGVNAGLQAYRERVAREKRSLLLDAAVERFLADGYDRATLETVAKTAGVSSATLYKHFRTKADLFGGVMARMWENEPGAEAALPPPGDPRAGLRRIGHDYAALLARSQTLALFRVIIAEAPRFPELGLELHERGKRPYLDRLRVYLQREIADGALAIDDLPLAKRQFLGMINDVVFWPRLMIVEFQIAPEEIAYVVDQAVETILARYATRPL